MVHQFVADLHLPISQMRLETYRGPSGSDLEMLVNYFWNIDLAEALTPCLHAAEVALRNSIHAAFTAHYGTDMWFFQPGVLEAGQLGQLATALRPVAKKPHPLFGRIVAELSFGFWVTLLTAPYEQRIWLANGSTLLFTVFPNAVGLGRKAIADRFTAIKVLRNRVVHYEPIWERPDLQREHAAILEAIEWISPTLRKAIQAVDNFPAVLGAKAQVEADLKGHLGIP